MNEKILLKNKKDVTKEEKVSKFVNLTPIKITSKNQSHKRL